MTDHRKIANAGGFGLVELMIGVVVMAIATISLISHLAINYAQTSEQRDRVFAYSVAQGLIAELQVAAATEEATRATVLEGMDDGTSTVATLTTAKVGGVLVPPDQDLSRNFQRNGQWVWSRQINVRSVPGNENRRLRYVTVRVFKRDGADIEREVASVSSVVSTLTSASPTAQVFDLYLIAIENAPGLWMPAETLRPVVMRAVSQAEQGNPGLKFRTHWITKFSYGRNPVYRPYVNENLPSTDDVPEVYYYPGRLPAGLHESVFYYVPSIMRGRILTDAGEQNGYDPVTNPYPYALSDFFNHAMRLPRERALHSFRVAQVETRKAEIAQAIEDGNPPPPELVDMSAEPTLRLFLEDLATDPDKYRHALIINLHGDLLPMPALRNYSDPAKEPVSLPGVRVVAHPEELRTLRPPSVLDTDVRVRVYAYTTDPTSYTGPTVMPTNRPIALEVMDLDLTDGAGNLRAGVTLQNLRGGVSVGGVTDYFPMLPAKPAGSPLVANEMYYEVRFVDPGPGRRKSTLLTLYHTPVVSPPVLGRFGGVQGLASTTQARLYGLEYVPGCTEPALDFSNDLASAGTGPKNTARWVLTIPGTVFSQARWVDNDSPPNYFDPLTTGAPDRMVTIRTRIWDSSLIDPLESGTVPSGVESRWLQPENLSETYCWWSSNLDFVPVTERSQFVGDPRLVPYRDMLSGSLDFPDAYNRFFDSLENRSQDAIVSFPGIDPILQSNPWQGLMRSDAPRFLELLRSGVTRSRTVLASVPEALALFLGHGGELIDSVKSGFAAGIPTDLRPFGSPGGSGTVTHVVQGRDFVRSGGASYWWGMPFLGELFPDWAYTTQWASPDASGQPRGNLSSGTGVSEFYRAPSTVVYANASNPAYGTAMLGGSPLLGVAGPPALLNTGSTASSFQHSPTGGFGSLSTGGTDFSDSFHYPLASTVPIARPFNLSASGPVGEHFSTAPYSLNRFSSNLIRSFYDLSSGSMGMASTEWINPTTRTAGHLVLRSSVRDFLKATEDAQILITASVQTYLDGGESGLVSPIQRLPRVIIRSPTETTVLTDPADISVLFEVEWRRWDGEPYTTGTPSSFSDFENQLFYSVMYSRDEGRTWQYVQDDSPAEPGVQPTFFYQVVDSGPGPEALFWATPRFVFPRGSYLLRVEAYRRDQTQHYAYHEKLIFIDR